LPASKPGLDAGTHDLTRTVGVGPRPVNPVVRLPTGAAAPNVEVMVQCENAQRDVLAGRLYVDFGYLTSAACRG
jgi:hypothetical protein